MKDDKPTVWTFYGDESEVVAELLARPSSTGLCKLSYEGITFVRHVSRLVPRSESAHKMLEGVKDVASDR
jgi:hypothetical protein